MKMASFRARFDDCGPRSLALFVSLKLKLKFQHSQLFAIRGHIFYGQKQTTTASPWRADNGKGVAVLSDKCSYISKVAAAAVADVAAVPVADVAVVPVVYALPNGSKKKVATSENGGSSSNNKQSAFPDD